MAESVKDILHKLQEEQAKAFDKQIDFKLDLYFNTKKIPVIDVQMFYSIAGDPTETHSFITSFSDNAAQNTIRLKKVQNFIQTATFNTED